MRRLVAFGLVLLVVCGLAWSLLGHRQSSTTDSVAARSSVAKIQVAELAPAQEDPNAKPAASITAATPPLPESTTGTLRGRLIDAATRQPVKEFEVQIRRVQRGPVWRQEEPLTQTFQSDAGRFSWNEVPADSWRVTVSAHGYLQFDLGEVTITAGKTTREVVMPLLHGFSLRGRIFAATTGAGIPDAWIGFRVTNAWGYHDNPSAKSKEDGTFVLDGVPGGDIELMVGAQGYAGRAVEITVDEKTPLQELALAVGGRIAGVLRSASGAPIEGQVGFGTFIVSDEGMKVSSEFSFDHLVAGHYVLSAITALGTGKQELDLAQNERREDIVIVISPGRSVRGSVRGIRSEHLTDARIILRSGSTFVTAPIDERGAYAISGVPPGSARVSVHAADREVSKTVDVPADQDVVLDLAFAAGARLSGHVTQGGKPATPRMVWMAPADAKFEWQYRGRTAPDGSYEIEGLPLGEYRIRADDDISRAITIAGDAVLNIEIPSVQLSGRVLEDGSTIPIVDAHVYIRGIDSATARVHAYKATNHFGEFSMTGIEPGEIMLIVYEAGYELYQEKISYSMPITNKTVALRKSSGVELRVRQSAQTARSERARGVMVVDTIPGADLQIDLWIPLNHEGVGSLPSALTGSKLAIQSNDGKKIVIDEWDGEPLELQL
jgi:carboxypeptidase family protein